MTASSFEPDTHTGPIPSPCIGLCQMNPATGLCDGCHRTIGEIAAWSSASETAKRVIWERLGQRSVANT